MAKKASRKLLEKKESSQQSVVTNTTIIDFSEEAFEARIEAQNILPKVSWINRYQVEDRGHMMLKDCDYSELAQEYPQHNNLLRQLVIGANLISPPGVSSTTVKDCFCSIHEFIRFLNSERNLSNTQVNCIADVNITVIQSFCNYLLSVYPGRAVNIKRWGALRRSISAVQNCYPNNPSLGQSFKWPAGPNNSESYIQGYRPEQIQELIDACIKDIKQIMQFHRRYDNNTKQIVLDEWNLENLMYHLHNRVENGMKKKNISVDSIIRVAFNRPSRQSESCQRKCIKDLGYTIEQVIALYKEKGPELALKGRDPFGTKITPNPDLARAELQFNYALATIKTDFKQYPYYMTEKEARAFLSCKKELQSNLPKEFHTILRQKVVSLISPSSKKISFMDGALGVNAVFASMHFVIDTLYPFLLLIAINSGWNLESVLAITDNVDDHVRKDIIEPDHYMIIESKKHRGAGKKKYKSVYHRSGTKRFFGTYSLLKYVESIIGKYKGSIHYQEGVLWQYTTTAVANAKALVTSFNERLDFDRVSNRFVERHKFQYIPEKTISFPRIRSGYAAMRALQGLTEFEISEDLGHVRLDTTSHYTSDISTNVIKDIAIGQLQEQFISDLNNLELRLNESKTLQDFRNAIEEAKNQDERNEKIKYASLTLNLEEKIIIQLISPGSQKYIASCKDAYNPTWPKYLNFVGKNEKCKYFNKCALCKQSIIFPEALPYIARRILDLEILQGELLPANWVIIYGDEYFAWSEILQRWNNKQQVAEAWEVAKCKGVVLPKTMRGA